MAHKSLIDSDELIRRTEQAMTQHYFYHSRKEYRWSEHKSWNEDELAAWKREKANIYCQMRSLNKCKMAKLFTQTFNNGYMTDFFKKYGLQVTRNGDVYFIDNGSPILKSYIEKVVLPALKAECHIEGVKSKDRITGMTANILNWERAKITED